MKSFRTWKLVATAALLGVVALSVSQLGTASTGPARVAPSLGAVLTGKAPCKHTATGRQLAATRQAGTDNVPNPLAGKVFTNTSKNCTKDAVQTIYHNTGNAPVAVSIDIVNSGTCPLLIGWAPQAGDFSHGQQWQFVTGKYKGEPFPVPQGMFLLASCQGSDTGLCKWRIANGKVR